MYKTLVHCRPIWPAAKRRVAACRPSRRASMRSASADQHPCRRWAGDRETAPARATMCPLPSGVGPTQLASKGSLSAETSVGLTIAQTEPWSGSSRRCQSRASSLSAWHSLLNLSPVPTAPLFDAESWCLRLSRWTDGVGQESKQQPCERFRLKALQPAPPVP